MTDAALEVDGLAVGYAGRQVLNDISFRLEAGRWLGLLGANGAGKSTLLRALTCQLRPAKGRVVVAGYDIARNPCEAKAVIGVAVDPADLPASLTGTQYLRLVAQARGLRTVSWPSGDLVEHLSAGPWRDTPLGACSLGTRAKFAICAALLGAPRLIILDLSLNGLDPLSSWQVRKRVSALIAETGASAILATHALEIAANACDEAIFLDEGAMLHHWSPQDLAGARESAGGFEDLVMGALLEKRAGGARTQA